MGGGRLEGDGRERGSKRGGDWYGAEREAEERRERAGGGEPASF